VKNPFDRHDSWPDSRRGMMQIAGATAAFAFWHSLLCSDGAKNAAKSRFGESRGTAWYRFFFMAQAVVTTGALFAFILTRPHRTLYAARGWKKLALWLGQGGALLLAFVAVRELDKAKFAGIAGVRALREGQEIPEAQAQGPEIESNGAIRATGVFRWTRHPLEWAPVLLLFSSPVMKTNWLTFDLLTTVYSVFGALHEEKRLLRQSQDYAKYQKEVPFLIGNPKPNESE
jgi:steroid 5-alpha reductase family enzyme